MLADFFTKPLQGKLFIKFKAVIMGHEHISTFEKPLPLDKSKERVENKILGEKEWPVPN